MKYIWLIFIIFFLNACSSSSNLSVSNMLQTENAKHIKNHYKDITSLLIEYKIKLDKRNPKNYDKNLDPLFRKNIMQYNNINLYSKSHKEFTDYTQYLNYAFSKDKIINRNDYLIIGLYKMFFEAFKMKSRHKITALSYDIETLQKVYKNLQVVLWKIKHNKDNSGNYLYLTWQNNWQIQLAAKLKIDKNYRLNIDELSYLKEKKESLLDPSNSSYEIIISKMLLHLNQSIKLLGAEPEELALDAILNFTFLI